MKLNNRFYIIFSVLIILSMIACNEKNVESETRFSELPASKSGINFENTLKYDREFNIYTYRNFYNGGGVAIGDINQDSLPDIYFTANMGPNKLYLNKGDFTFEDISKEAGIEGTKTWSTGVTMVDIDGDGDLDIYVCNSGDVGGANKQNELFINDGAGKFNESAEKHGLADQGYSTHSAFFDFDRDGDLDMYLLNNSYQAIGSFNLRKNVRNVRDVEGGDKLFRNDDGVFTDVSVEAGIYGSVIGFGLGVTIGDINQDGWQDIYVSNDFFEKDYIYINNGNGTFTEDLESYLSSISVASMGADMADINNDGNPDIFVTEMLPGEERRIKTKTTFEDWDRYQYAVDNDYYHQFTRNMLHYSNGDGSFTEVGRISGVHATDWSWGALIADLDNDGLKDLYVTNGIFRDLTDQDFLNYISNEEFMKTIVKDSVVDYRKLIEAIPSERIANYAFKNLSKHGFENKAEEWGLNKKSHSNGAAYGDLDNDGDLDLVVNNVNMPAFVYRNNTNGNNFFQVSLKGSGKNTFAIGSKLYLYTSMGMQYLEHMPMKGFQSSMDYLSHFGLQPNAKLDSLKVIWPDNTRETIKNLEKGKRIYLTQGKGIKESEFTKQVSNQYFEDITDNVGLDFKHIENNFVDFNRDRLLYAMKSSEGPFVAVADINNDGKEDLTFSGAKDQATSIYIQKKGKFQALKQAELVANKASENLQITYLDLDGDNDKDLYVANGGNEFSGQNSALKDHIYFNDGSGNLTKSDKSLSLKPYMVTSSAKPGDYDNDGDDDLFIGERMQAFAYGVPASGFILHNDNGQWKDVSNAIAPGLKNIGMIRDAMWGDINGDSFLDLVVVGEYMPISIFIQENGKFENRTSEWKLNATEGWWNKVTMADIDKDGDLDLIAGNHGLNSRFKGDSLHPICMYVNDFDRNGSVEQIICLYEGENSYPLALRHDLIEQLPHIKKKYLDYKGFANQKIEDIFSEEERKNMLTLYAREMETTVYLNEGNYFKKVKLPIQAQYSPVMAIHTMDVNNDGNLDLVMGGNLFRVKPEIGRYDASFGQVFLGKGDGTFVYLPNSESGFRLKGEIRDIQEITLNDKICLVITRNNDTAKIFQLKN